MCVGLHPYDPSLQSVLVCLLSDLSGWSEDIKLLQMLKTGIYWQKIDKWSKITQRCFQYVKVRGEKLSKAVNQKETLQYFDLKAPEFPFLGENI